MAARRTFTYQPSGGDPTGLVIAYREADSQVFVEGDVVFLSSLLLTLAGTDPTKILGIALEPATNVTSGHKLIKVQVIRPGDLFKTQFAGANAFVVATDQGKGYGIIKTSAGLWEVDKAEVAANNMRVAVQQTREFTSDGKANPTNGGPIFARFVITSGAAANILQYADIV